MATIPGIVLQLIEASWQLSIAFIPLLYLGFLGYAVAVERQGALLDTVVWSQRSYTTHYGVYTVTGLIAGGVPAISLSGGTGIVTGGAVALAACMYGYMEHGLPDVPELDMDVWRDRFQAVWVLVPVLAATAVATANPLLKSITALVFLTAVFWKV